MITSKGYNTYVLGERAFYTSAMLEQLQENISAFGRCYISNWRILHIDGFEDGYIFLPERGGYDIHFTWSQKVGQKTQDGSIEWTNLGKYQK
jgi:hypothetical protein